LLWGIVIWLLGIAILFYLLQAAIKNALNASELTQHIGDIKTLLMRQEQARASNAFNEATMELCPGCQSRVARTAAYCSSCGLRQLDY